MEKHKVTAMNIITKQNIDLIIEEDELSEDILLSISINGQVLTSRNYGYFEAFKELKDKLLSLNYGLKCKGSLINAVQSRMAEASEKIYLVTLGQSARLKDLVSIYDYIDINEFATSEEQNEFSEKWHESFGL